MQIDPKLYKIEHYFHSLELRTMPRVKLNYQWHVFLTCCWNPPIGKDICFLHLCTLHLLCFIS